MPVKLILFIATYLISHMSIGADTLRISKKTKPSRNFVLTTNNYISIRLKNGDKWKCKIVNIDSGSVCFQRNNAHIRNYPTNKTRKVYSKLRLLNPNMNITDFMDSIYYPIRDTVQLSEIKYIKPTDNNVVSAYHKYYNTAGYIFLTSYVAMHFFLISGICYPIGLLASAGTATTTLLVYFHLDNKKFSYKKWNYNYQ